jgi:mono/diheme cytochrome c family protein
MRTKIVIHAALLALGFALPVWASPQIASPPAQDMEPKLDTEARQKPAMPAVLPRGQMLYENHCLSCHESLVHIRAGQQAKSLPQLRANVQRWVEYLQLHWGREEVEDVVIHLNDQYYKFKLSE